MEGFNPRAANANWQPQNGFQPVNHHHRWRYDRQVMEDTMAAVRQMTTGVYDEHDDDEGMPIPTTAIRRRQAAEMGDLRDRPTYDAWTMTPADIEARVLYSRQVLARARMTFEVNAYLRGRMILSISDPQSPFAVPYDPSRPPATAPAEPPVLVLVPVVVPGRRRGRRITWRPLNTTPCLYLIFGQLVRGHSVHVDRRMAFTLWEARDVVRQPYMPAMQWQGHGRSRLRHVRSTTEI